MLRGIVILSAAKDLGWLSRVGAWRFFAALRMTEGWLRMTVTRDAAREKADIAARQQTA